MTPRAARLPGGLALQYVERGDPSGTPVILLHGMTDSWRSFELLLPLLPPSIRAVALTQRGHGDSDKPAASYRPTDLAADVAGVMDVLGISAAVIVGHSMGSRVAVRFGLEYPARTLGLVLLGACADLGGNAAVRELAGAIRNMDPIDPSFAREFQEATVAHPLPPAFLETIVQESMKAPARVWRAALDGLFADDSLAHLGKIPAPTLLLWGEHDAFFGQSDQVAFLAGIAGAQLSVYEDTGHAPHWERTDRVATELTAFARGIAKRN
jgi:pimeloyl-ACP methyl ester carboxylesterase